MSKICLKIGFGTALRDLTKTFYGYDITWNSGRASEDDLALWLLVIVLEVEMSTICPGQDTRYWRPGDIFDIACGACGTAVEFFKDDARRRCPSCGAVVQNPKITLGCAQWCEHAKACLGYDPKALDGDDVGEANEGSLLDRLREALELRLGESSSEASRARDAVAAERRRLEAESATGDDHRVLLASALLRELASSDADAARELMTHVEMDRSTIDDVCRHLGIA